MGEDTLLAMTGSEYRSVKLAKIRQLEESLFHQHMVRYLSQTPPLLGSIDPDEIEKLAGEKLNKGTFSVDSPNFPIVLD